MFDIRQAAKDCLARGFTDPYEIADVLRPQLLQDQEAVGEFVRRMLPHAVKQAIHQKRSSKDNSGGHSAPVYVPSKGWRDASKLTSDDCLEVANAYYLQAAENAAKGRLFESWAEEMKRDGVEYLGGLASYKRYLSDTTKAGLERARQRGSKSGRPRIIPNDVVADWETMRIAGYSMHRIAQEANSGGFTDQEGKAFTNLSISRYLTKRRRADGH